MPSFVLTQPPGFAVFTRSELLERLGDVDSYQ